MVKGGNIMIIITCYINDRYLYKPKEKKDIDLFKHCSGGLIAVTPKFFLEEVKPLLKLHGVTIDFKEEKKI